MKIAALSTGDHVDLCITSAATDYTHMDNAASSTGDHVDLCITSTTTDYTRMENAASIDRRSCWLLQLHAWRMPLHRPAIMLAFA